MRLDQKLEDHRIQRGPMGSEHGDNFGMFVIPGPCGQALTIIASDGELPSDNPLGGWEHVSVSGRRVPNWQEMSFVKNLFWSPEECVVEYHPPASEHVNNHPRCLHMWRWTRGAFPMPPSILVGVKQLGNLEEADDAKI
jgi:hypothetical protein